MSEVNASTRPKKTVKNGATQKPSTRTRAKSAAAPVSADERRTLIEQRAYLRAEARGFQGGDPVEDWLVSEKEVDTLLSRR